MRIEDLRPSLTEDYSRAARAYAFDLIATVIIYAAVSLLAGRVWRFPFDDEIIALAPIERFGAARDHLMFYLNGGDIHPPLSFVWFYALNHLGLSEAGIRLCSLAMSAFALALFQLLALMLIARRNGSPVGRATRLMAVLLFALSPLMVGQGDAIRWYPIFALLIALFATFTIAGANTPARFGSAIALGLAASTNFLAAFVVLPLLVYRHFFERQFRWRFDLGYWLLFTLFAGVGIWTAISIVLRRLGSVAATEFGHGIMMAAGSNVLGFFGGNALGLGRAWIAVPIAFVAVLAIVTEYDARHRGNPVNLLLLMLVAPVLMVLAGFTKPRSFLYLAPVMAAILLMYLDRLFYGGKTRERRPGLAVLLAVLLVSASTAAIAHINGSKHPFKRNAVIPYQSVLDFIAAKESGNVLVVSTDSVIPWLLRHGGERRCVSYFLQAENCFKGGRRYDSIIVIAGHSQRSRRPTYMRQFNSALDTLTAGRTLTATLELGLDLDAELKSRLTGVALSRYILTARLYR